MSIKNGIMNRVLEALKELGKATVADLAEYLDITAEQSNTALCNLEREKKTRKRQIYVQSWKRAETKVGPRYFKCYAIGDKRNASKPKPMTQLERDKRYKQRLKGRQTNSVFALAAGYREHFALRKQLNKVRVSPTAQANDEA